MGRLFTSAGQQSTKLAAIKFVSSDWVQKMKMIMIAARILCSLILIFQSVTFSAAQGQQPAVSNQAPFVLQDGTPIKLRLSQTVSSADAHVNDQVEFGVLEDVMVDNVVVVQKGASALSTVTEAVPTETKGPARSELRSLYTKRACLETCPR
jgi:hypothetical protein